MLKKRKIKMLKNRIEKQISNNKKLRNSLLSIQKNKNIRIDNLQNRVDKLIEANNGLREALRKANVVNKNQKNAQVTGDPLNLTSNWNSVESSGTPFVTMRKKRLKVLFLNSMGGSASRLIKGLMLNENIEADCFIAAYYPRRHLVYPLETNVFNVFTHDEWREFMAWSVHHYDIIQSTTLPLSKAVAECYDWLTEKIGRRHIWRSTGFVHHYLLRDDVLPLEYYQNDLKTNNKPSPDRFTCKTFKIKGKYIYTDPQVLFYSSPEKGAYFKGKDTYWLPSIREPELYYPDENYRAGEKIKVYVPYHKASVWKGLHFALSALNKIKERGAPIEIITPENAGEYFPDLQLFKNHEGDSLTAYPIPNRLMPELFRKVDIVVDQLVMGSYGNTGIEAMFSGKVVVGQKKYDDIQNAPIWEVDFNNFESRFEDLLKDRYVWKEYGEAGREYAMKVHTPKAVAKRASEQYLKIVEENAN